MSKVDSLPSEPARIDRRVLIAAVGGVAAAGALAAAPANAGQLVSDDLLEIRRVAALAEQNGAYAQLDDLARRIWAKPVRSLMDVVEQPI
jgi:hypothetical protein